MWANSAVETQTCCAASPAFHALVRISLEMRRRGVEYGAATLCGGGGQGYALILRAPDEA